MRSKMSTVWKILLYSNVSCMFKYPKNHSSSATPIMSINLQNTVFIFTANQTTSNVLFFPRLSFRSDAKVLNKY